MPEEYADLCPGELFKDGDEMQNPNTGKWEAVPKQWIKGGCSYQLVGTVGRFNIRMRRKVGVGETNDEPQSTGF